MKEAKEKKMEEIKNQKLYYNKISQDPENK